MALQEWSCRRAIAVPCKLFSHPKPSSGPSIVPIGSGQGDEENEPVMGENREMSADAAASCPLRLKQSICNLQDEGFYPDIERGCV